MTDDMNENEMINVHNNTWEGNGREKDNGSLMH